MGVHVNTHVRGSIGLAYAGLRNSIHMCEGSSGLAYTIRIHYLLSSYKGTKSIQISYTTLGESWVVYEHLYRSGAMGIRGDFSIHIYPRP